jgi:hypothetical protein
MKKVAAIIIADNKAIDQQNIEEPKQIIKLSDFSE